jgi:hypothetical protein
LALEEAAELPAAGAHPHRLPTEHLTGAPVSMSPVVLRIRRT